MASEGPIGDRVKLPHQLWGPSTMVRWDSLTESFNPIFFLTKFLLPKFSFYFKVCFNYFFHWEFFGTTFFCEHIFLLLKYLFHQKFLLFKKNYQPFLVPRTKIFGPIFFHKFFYLHTIFFPAKLFFRLNLFERDFFTNMFCTNNFCLHILC